MNQPYVLTLSFALGVSVVLGLLLHLQLYLQRSKSSADPDELAPVRLAWACALSGLCVLMVSSAQPNFDAAWWARGAWLLIPVIAFAFGHSLLALLKQDCEAGWPRRLERAHRGLSLLAALTMLVDLTASTHLLIEPASSAYVGAGFAFSATPLLGLYFAGAALSLLGLLGAALRFLASGRSARVLFAAACVLYMSTIYDFAFWLGIVDGPPMQAFGASAYLAACVHGMRQREGRVLTELRENVQVLESHRRRLLLSASQLQQQRLDSLGALSAVIAHEINNPIQGIMNYAGLLRMTLRDQPAARDYLDKMDAESERVARIARGILRFGKADDSGETLADVAEIVHATLALTRGAIRKESISLHLNIAPELPLVRCHPSQLQQVLINLLTNARDALALRCPTREDEKILSIAVEVAEREGRPWVVFSVGDNGEGMASEVASRVFAPFFTTKSERGGTGLGLPISQGIAEAHGGSLRLLKTQAPGSVFVLELPCAQEVAMDLRVSA